MNIETNKRKTNSYSRLHRFYRDAGFASHRRASRPVRSIRTDSQQSCGTTDCPARKFQPEVVVIANEEKYSELKEALSDLPIKVYAGTDAICQIVEAGPIDMVLTAMVGYAGLKPTINAIRAKKAIALANKETLVVAGELIKSVGTTISHSDSAGRL